MPSWNGVLLAWIATQMEDQRDIFLITRIRIRSRDNPSSFIFYRFKAEDFLILSSCEYDIIKEFPSRLDRFEMSNGSFYSFETSDGEYTQDRLVYHSKVLNDPYIQEESFANLLS